MNDYYNELKQKYNYNEYMIIFFKRVIPILIEYYGKEYEDHIREAILNCEICVENDEETYKEFYKRKFNKRPPYNRNNYGAFLITEIENDNYEPKQQLAIYVYNNKKHPFLLNDERCDYKLVHELCHLVKTYNHIKEIDNYTVIERSGLRKNKYILNPINLKYMYLNVENRILEEALNCYDEQIICNMLYENNRTHESYKGIVNLVPIIMSNKTFREKIKRSQLEGDDTWELFLGIKESDLFSKYIKKIYKQLCKTSDGKTKMHIIQEAQDYIMNMVEENHKTR